MAEALAGLIAGDLFDAKSAGTHPAGLNPLTVQVMEELGVDVRHARSKHVEEFLGQSFDYVVTVCDRARETCPIVPSASRVLHWSFEDPAAAPAAERFAAFRHVRDEIADRLCRFVVEEQLLPSGQLNCYRCDPLGQ